MASELPESRFYMWRAIVAMAHADGVVTPHEISFIHEYAQDVPFNKEEVSTLANDLHTPQDAYEMYAKITELQDKKDFFALARALSWCDGDYAAQEKQIITCLEQLHMDDEHQEMLQESREMTEHLKLNGEQWDGDQYKGKGIMSFLTKLKTGASA